MGCESSGTDHAFHMAPQENNQDLSSELYLKHAHDHLFRESMQDIEICRYFALLILPQTLKGFIDWETLEIVKNTWIDEKLKEYRSDVLYRVKLLNTDQWVYLLFEHKSAPDKKVHKQLLRYMVEIWDQYEKQVDFYKLLPVVISIIVYHGNTPCDFANSIKPLFAIIEETKEYVPDFRKCILDLLEFKPELIEDSPPFVADYCGGRSKLKMFLLALKHGRSSDVLRVLPQIIRVSENVQSGEYDYLKVVLIYLASVINRSSIDQFLRIIAKEHNGGEVYMETIADALRKEERLKREKAERRLRKEIEQRDTIIEQKDTVIEKISTEIKQMIQRMLKKGMDSKSIQEITGLNNEKIEGIIKEINRDKI